jgi:hypothetical protein
MKKHITLKLTRFELDVLMEAAEAGADDGGVDEYTFFYNYAWEGHESAQRLRAYRRVASKMLAERRNS